MPKTLTRLRYRTSFGALGSFLAIALAWPVAGWLEGPDLATGVQQVKEGDFEGALLTLDILARQWAGEPARSKDLTQAHLYLGVAYVGLGQESLARAKFQQALRQDGSLRLSPEEFWPKVLRTFEAARQALIAEAALQEQAKKKPRRSAAALIVLGGAGAAGIAVAATTGTKERSNSPPTASFRVLPEGQAIVDVTRMTFTASATDPEGDALSYSWEFGDGTTGEGATATHIYGREGSLVVRLTVRDGLSSTVVSGPLTARTLSGTWRVAGDTFAGISEFQFRQGQGGLLSGDWQLDAMPLQGSLQLGAITDPRSVTLNYWLEVVQGAQCTAIFRGEADSTLQTIRGIQRCHHRQPNKCSLCDEGQEDTITLSR